MERYELPSSVSTSSSPRKYDQQACDHIEIWQDIELLVFFFEKRISLFRAPIILVIHNDGHEVSPCLMGLLI